MIEQPVLVIVPSPLIMARTYRDLAQRLRQAFDVYVPEMPGSGDCLPRDKVWSGNEYANWLIQFLEHHRIRKAFLLGHSNSGAIALSTAALAPDRVQGLILADTTGLNQRGYLQVLGGRAVDAVHELIFSIRASPHLLNNAFRHFKNFQFQIRESIESQATEEIKKVRCPTLILWGRSDLTMPLAYAHELQSELRDASLYISQRGSHDWILTRPHESSKAIMDWVQSLEAGPSPRSERPRLDFMSSPYDSAQR